MTPWTVSRAGSPVHEILQAGILEWVAILFSRDLPDPGIEPQSSALQADSLLSEPPGNGALLIIEKLLNVKDASLLSRF